MFSLREFIFSVFEIVVAAEGATVNMSCYLAIVCNVGLQDDKLSGIAHTKNDSNFLEINATVAIAAVQRPWALFWVSLVNVNAQCSADFLHV